MRDYGLKRSVFVDADYVTASTDRRPVSGVSIMMGKMATEQYEETCDDCVAFCDAAKQATFKRVILFLLQRQLAGIRIYIFGDNEDPMALENNPSSASRSKHIQRIFT